MAAVIQHHGLRRECREAISLAQANSLDHRWTRLVLITVFEGDDPAQGLRTAPGQQFSRVQQERRTGGLAKLTITRREGLVNQDAAGREAGQQGPHQRAVKIIADDDAAETLRPEGPVGLPGRLRVFEVELQCDDTWRARRCQRCRVAIDCQHGMPQPGKETTVPATATREIEYRTRRYPCRKPTYPG